MARNLAFGVELIVSENGAPVPDVTDPGTRGGTGQITLYPCEIYTAAGYVKMWLFL
ncbi:MAG: hypothetical protein P8013_07355 [Candidatus Sulfobium sp.]|jgi:hypothetical protein